MKFKIDITSCEERLWENIEEVIADKNKMDRMMNPGQKNFWKLHKASILRLGSGSYKAALTLVTA